MIPFEKSRRQTIPESSVKIIGLGGAGANMLDRVALDGLEGAELLALNTDIRTLASSVAQEKIQLGLNLTKGLGTGGDPDLGEKAVLEAESKIVESLEGRKIVFICVGLGGGTGSGAAPIVTRLAREAGAFTVVFATMPFAFEGRRRREQAEESLNQLAVLSNALVTFDNGRMGELVLPKQGVHEAFAAADRMISDSINAVARLVLRPGLINVGLDELMTALKTNRSRCLFGSGLANGENRAQGALKAALNSPLLDRGTLLKEASTVLVHICGGEDLTMYEVELLMDALTKHIPADCHLLFGAATDPAMNDALSVTIISALPEDRLQSSSENDETEMPEIVVAPKSKAQSQPDIDLDEGDANDDEGDKEDDNSSKKKHAAQVNITEEETEVEEENDDNVPDDVSEDEDVEDDDERVELSKAEADDDSDMPWEGDEPKGLSDEIEEEDRDDDDHNDDDGEPFAEAEVAPHIIDISDDPETPKSEEKEFFAERDEDLDEDDEGMEIEEMAVTKTHIPPKREEPKKRHSPQTELELDGGPKGRFEGEEPNLLGGEDLDVPPYLRKNKRR